MNAKRWRCPKCGGKPTAKYDAVSDILELRCGGCCYEWESLPLDNRETGRQLAREIREQERRGLIRSLRRRLGQG